MQIKLEPWMPEFPKLLSAQQSIIASVLSTAAKTDETAFKKQQTDKLAELLDEIRASNPPLIRQ